MKNKTKWLIPMIVPAIYWAGGFNFDERSATAGICVLSTSVVALLIGLLSDKHPKARR
jgi:hypothetical protein